MASKYPKFIALSLVLMLIISGIAYFVMLTAQNYTPLARMKNAQDVAKMSGEYQFRTDIDQVSGYAPSLTNYGRESRHDQLVVEGTINESSQTSTMTISNANGVMLEVRRERGQTYARQPGTGWQRTASNSTAQINTLSYLAGMTNAKVVGSDGNSFDFGFDGNAFAEHFARLLSADAAHGIKYSDEWYSIAQSNQFKEANGDGNLTLDSDGLPKNMTLNLTMPGNNNNGTVQTSIKTSFFAYARTGLALKKVLNNPFTLVGNLLGTDTSAVKTVLFSLLAVLAVTIIGALVHLFRRRLYLPVTLLALGMLVFQPFSNIPRSYAATSAESAPTPGPDSTTPSKPEVTFNPLVSPLQQMGTVVLPSAGTTTANDTVVVSGSQSRSLTTRDGRAITDTPVCGQLGDDIKNLDYDGDGLTNEQECMLEIDPTKTDNDSDGLNDFAEVQLGTSSKLKDSDLDGIDDAVEVTKFTQYAGTGPKFYTNPLKSDTNGDGISDGDECTIHGIIDISDINTTDYNCPDTNNDRIPDFLTYDNDGDGVPDNYDISPTLLDINTQKNVNIYDSINPFKLQFNKTTPNTSDSSSLTVNIQVRPSDVLMYKDNAVYDWPSGDSAGQIQRSRDTTFANFYPTTSKDPSANNGDVKVTSMLEIRIPITNTEYRGLPITSCTTNTGIKLNANDPNSCIDNVKTAKYSMNIDWSRNPSGTEIKSEVTVSIPLSPTYDSSGTIVAYTALMYYDNWKQVTNNDIRMQWIVSSIQDAVCTPDEKTNTQTAASCAKDNHVEHSDVIQRYYGKFTMIGLTASINLGTTATVIYEKTTNTPTTLTSQRRLNITQLFNYLSSDFIAKNALAITAANITTPQPANLLASFTKNYASMYDAITINEDVVKPILNKTTIGVVTKLTPNQEQNLDTSCKENTTVTCRPAMIVLTESRDITLPLSDDKIFTIDYQQSNISRSRTLKGTIFKRAEGYWIPEETNDFIYEMSLINQSVNNISKPVGSTLSDTEWDSYIQAQIIATIDNFNRIQSSGCPILTCADIANQYASPSPGEITPQATSWGSEITNTYSEFQSLIDKSFERLSEEQETKSKNDDAVTEATEGYIDSAAAHIDIIKDFQESIEGFRTDVPAPNSTTRQIWTHNSIKGIKIVGHAIGMLNVTADLTTSLLVSQGKIDENDPTLKAYKYTVNSIELLEAVESAYRASTLLIRAVKFPGGVNRAINLINQVNATNKLTTITKATKFARFAKLLGPVSTAINYLVVVVVGIMSAVNAEYGWQKANALASMSGQILAMVFLAAISNIPIVGQLIAAVVALFDAIAAIVCEGLDEAAKRTTSAKLFCGGITGLLANLFTPYAANIVVDPDDEWSRKQTVDANSVPPNLTSPVDGYRVNNKLNTTLIISDSIHKMEQPASWQSLVWFLQWNNQDIRDTSFAYSLGYGDSSKIDLSNSITIGGQRSKWTGPSKTIDGKTYEYTQAFTASTIHTFNTSGINTSLPPMWLSQSIKVPQQTCITVWITWIIMPICWIETHTTNPKYINFNDKEATKYDIFPATVEEFVTMRLRNAEAGYTFAWSPDTAQPPFPVFKDADNDGLSNEQEKIYSTSDNAYDTDGDSISDNREVALTTNPVLNDSDNDGLTDGVELQMHTNPLMPDSDGDGLLDGEEVVHTVKDGANVTLVGGWSVTYNIAGNSTWVGSDPLNADADGDQITDLREKVLGWSPYAKNSGEILKTTGTVREALMPAVQVGFDNNNNPKAFSNSGFVASDVQCVDSSTLSITCPTVTTTTDRTLPSSTTMNPYVTLASTQSLDVGNGPQSNFDSQFTIAAWLKRSATTYPKLIISRTNLLLTGYTSAGAVLVLLYTTKGTYTLTTADGVLPAGSWKHLAVTYGNQALVVYVDGVEVGRAAVAGNLSTTPTQKLIAGNGYAGGIDDIAVYQVALRAGEITQLKNGALAGGNDLIVKPGDRLITTITQANKLLGRSIQEYSTINSVSVANGFESNQIETASLTANASTSFDSIVTVPGTQNISTTPSSYASSCVYAGNELCVKFDETASSTKTFTDLSSNQNNLVCTTNCPTLVNSGWNFSTTTNNGATTLDTKATVGNAISARDFTIAAWVRPEGNPTTQRPIVNSSNTNALMQVALANERPQFSMGSATALVASNALAINSWSHVLYTFAAGKRSIYVNGVIVATDANAIAYPGSFGVLNVGKNANNNSFNGSLRDLQIYSNALNLRQITALANTCEDPQLIACMPLSGNTSDMSIYGNEQGSVLSNAGNNGVLSSSATMPVGYAKLISDHDFTMVAKVKLGSTTANQTIMQTATAVGSGNQFKVTTSGTGIATLSVGTLSLTAGSALVANTPYIITARFRAGVWSLRVERVADSTLQTTTADFGMTSRVTVGNDANNQTIMQTGAVLNSPNQYQVTTDATGKAILQRGTTALAIGPTLNKNTTYTITAKSLNGSWSLTATNPTVSQSETTFVEDTTLHQAQEPLSIGQSGMTINNIRIYRTAVSDTTLAAVARNALFGTLSVALNNPPVSDLLQISVDARSKVINPTDPNFERMPDNCTVAVVCLPFTSNMDNTWPSNILKPATASQSSTGESKPAINAIDGNSGTFNHTTEEYYPWLDIDLCSGNTTSCTLREIRNVVVINRSSSNGTCAGSGCQDRITGAIVFLSTASLGANSGSNTISTNKKNSVTWRNLNCNNQEPTCAGYRSSMLVNFPAGTKARFIRIQLPTKKYLHIQEVKINQPEASICQSTGACPTISNGGANFTTGKHVSISPEVSKATFYGTTDAQGAVTPANFTVMTWVRFNAISGEQAIMYDRSDISTRNNRLNLGITAGKLYFSYYLNVLNGTNVLQPNTWYHVAFVKDGATRKIYLNGTIYATDTKTGVDASLASAREMFIGETDTSTSSLNGTLRDFQIHKTALDLNAIGQVADINKAATTKSFELRIPFDEPAISTQFSDVLTTGLSLSCLSATDCPLSGQPGRDDRAVHFDGGQGLRFNPSTNTSAYVDYINKTANPNYTISMWVRPSAYGTWLLGNDTITQKLRVGINKDGYLSYEQGRFNVSTLALQSNATIKWPASPLLSSQKLPLNSWSHITVSTAGNAEYVYVNGVVSSRNTTLFKAPITAVAGTTTLSTTGLGQTTVNSPLSSNVNAPTVINETVALANSNSTTVSGYALNTTTKTISLGQSRPLNGATSATIGMWVKPTNIATNGNAFILASEDNYEFQIGTNGSLSYQLDTSTSNPTWINTGIIFTSDKWQYLSMVLDANEPDANKKLTFRIDQSDGTNVQTKYYAATGYIEDNGTCDLLLGANCTDNTGRKAFTGSIGNVFITPRALSEAELVTLRSEPITLANARKYGNADAPAPTVNLAETFVGDLDELRISPIATTDATAVLAEMNQAPSWNLTFEDGLYNNRTEIGSDGKNKVIQINAVTLPNDVPGRAGINRFSVAASCDIPEISGVECPVGNTVGMAGTASLFNGTNTMLQVGNGTTLIDQIKNGGTIQLMIKPDKLTGTQTLLHYGDTSGNTAFQMQIVGDKVKLTFGSTITFTSSTKLAMAWNQISFSFGATGFKYFQNGTQDSTINSTSAVTLGTNQTFKLRIGGKISGSSLSEMFQGGIDDITFTPSTMVPAKIYRIARSQTSQTMTKTDIASVTIDAEPPIVQINNPAYVGALPQQFTVMTKDVSSSVVKVDTTSALDSSSSASTATSKSTPNSARTITIDTPPCIDAVAGSAFCPTFDFPQSRAAKTTIEGKYRIISNATDEAGNVGTAQSTILVDTTPPTATLIRPTSTYVTTWAPNQNIPELTIRLSATDPVLTNSGNSAGSGVKSLSVNLKDAAGRLINKSASIPATFNAGEWTATIPLPFGNPSGFYQVEAIVTDNMGNQSSEIKVADANSTSNPMIEVDSSAPRDVISYPSPYNPDNYFLGNQAITGRVSDIGDGRTALQQGLRIRLDFEAPDGAQAFDNRADSRYNTSCSTCPVIAPDGSSSNKIARFNIDNSATAQQSLTVANAATVLTGTFSIALMAKINDVGTLISTGVASTPRLRIQVSKVGSAFQVTAKKGNASVATPATLNSNTWYYFIYSEYREGTTSSISLASGSNLATLTTATAIYTGALPPVQPDITIGAMQSSAGNSAKEDFFRGYIDDVLLSPSQLVADDLIGKALAQGSGTQRHLTRLAIDDDGYTGNDRLTDNIDFYMPMNQSSLPVVDAINGIRSSRCTADTTVAPSTCPMLSEGFASNAVLLQRNSDGIKSDYQLQTSASTAKSMALRFKIGVDATSGLLAWLQAPSSSDSLAMQIGYDKDLQSVTVRINDKNTTLLATSEAVAAINDNNWHTMVITSTGSGTNEQVSVYIDGTLVVNKTIAGHWVNATLGLGALTDVSGYSGRGTATAAAINTAIDDLAIFSTALTSANIIDYSFGYSTVYHETFDDGRITPGAITSDDSPYHQPSTITSGDDNLTNVVGTVGSAAIAFDGNDEVIHRDTNTQTFAPHNQPWSLSAWVTPKNAGSNGTIIRGTLNSYSYELSLIAGQPKFTMAGMSVTGANQLDTNSASHIIVSSDGTNLSMYVNGTSVTNTPTPTSIGSNEFTRTLAIIPFTGNKSQSSTVGSNGAGNGYDGNLNNYSLTPSTTNPYWYISNTNSTAMDNVTIYSRVSGKPLSNFTLFVSDTLPDMTVANNRIQSVTTASKWSYRMNGTVSDRVTIPLPIGTTGKYVIIIADGANRTIALNDVQITLLPTIKIGTGFSGIIDDVRIYRKALTAADRDQLKAMAWQQSDITSIDGYTTWSRPAVSGMEVNTRIQSMTVDNNNNSLVTAGENSLWQGAIDTRNPRITATNVSNNYSVQIEDRNLNTQQMTTPCGSKLAFSNVLPTSLWFLQHMSVFDGTYSTPTRFTGTCTLAPYPEVIQTNSQIVSNTNTLVYGNRFAYMGGINQISTLDVKPSTPITQRVITIAGTVTQLSVNRAKDKLYAISTQNGGSLLTIFDIASNPLIPRQLGTLAIALPTGIRIAHMGIAGSATADTYVMLADTSTPANVWSIDVSIATTPRTGTISAVQAVGSNNTPTVYGMAVQNDILVLAHGIDGVATYRISESGASDYLSTYNTTGYAQNVFINGNDLLIIDDDEPFDGTNAPTSPNTLRTIDLIASVTDNTATLNDPLTERNTYRHITPFDGDNVVGYRIVDIVPYRTGELMILSSATDYPNNQRISIIDTAGDTGLLKNDTRVNTTSPIRLATNSQNVIALTQQGTTTNLIGYQVSDARLTTYACDVLNNCTTVSSASSIPITLGLTSPAQSSIRIINPATVYASDTPTIQVSAETATAGIDTISLLVNGQIVQTHSITGAPQQVEDEFRLENLGSGTYTITTQFTDTQTSPATVTSMPVETAIDLQAPQINVIDSVVGATQIINNVYVVRVVITDDVGVDNIQIVNKLTNARIPYTSKKQGNITTASVFYTPQRTYTQGLQLRVIATDRVGNITTRDQTVVIDTMPPVTDATISTTVNGKAITLSEGQTVTQTNPINVTWTKVSDASPITLHNLEYAVTTVNGSTAYTNTTTVPANSLSIATGKFPTLTTTEASRVSAKVRLRDELGNGGATQLPVFYADTPQTPDYTLMNSTEPTYRGFITNGCAALGEDRRPGLDNIQRFAMTWDSQAVRMNWQGADWEYDGNLFIYLDTIPGGTVQAYRPSNYTQNITDSVTLGESFITLPVNMAARSVAAGSNIASYVNDFQTALTQSQQGIRTSSIQGTDYVIAINSRTNAQLLTWNGSAWVDTNSPITYQYVNERGVKQTDIRTLFSQIGYTTGNPLGVVAFATKPNSFMPWATFPSSNPVPNDQGNNKFTITPLLNGYGWSNLTSGVCPNTAALNPDSTQIVASLTSTPNGVFNRALADNFANTDPDAITQIISETAPMCGVLTSDSWCNTVAQYGTINNTGSALLATLAGNLASEQDPVVGNNSVVTYTLNIQNPTNKPTRRMYGIIQTYGGIWLTDSNSTGTPAVAIIGGGNYTYHNVSASGLRDYQLIQFNPVAANSSQTITFRAKIDPSKPLNTTSDRIKTSSIAKVEVRMVDDSTGTNPTNFNVNRTIEWLNAAVAIDTSAPSQVLPDTQTVMTRGAFTITGSVRDQSTVSNVYLEYYTNTNSSSRTQINCGAAVTGRWTCPVTIPNTATSITYRVRASDVYKQQSPWSGWYGATIDITPPTFVLDPVTTSVSNASYVGGSAISLSGFLTDTTSTANIKVCDQSQALCEFGSTTNPTINQSVIVALADMATEVTAQSCENTPIADYTSIPITISSGANDQRLSSVTVDVNVTSAAANELDLWLRSPSGTLTQLMTSLRPSMVNLLARFDDNAVNATTSLTGTTDLTGMATAVKPDSALSLLSGEAINGNWQLLACDRNENSTHSFINEWSITLNNSSSSVSTNAPWSYTVKNTSNQDNVTRKLTLWGVDAVNNTSTSRSISLNIDTVAPNFTITQLLDTMLSGSNQTAFQGTLSEGGTLSSLSANIYDSKKLVKNIPISVQSMQSQDLSRWNYLLSRTISNYTWELPIETYGFQSGTYTVQFIATDVAGNQRTSDAYTILVPEFTAPSITNISTANTFPNTTFTLTYKADTGKDMGDVFITVALDSAVTAPITDTTLQMWGSSGFADSTSQAKIPASLQNTLISQLEMNNHLAAALDSNGTLTTWALQNSNTVNVTTPISDVMQLSDIAQFAIGDSSNQHLLTLSNTGIITDYTPTGATSVPITDAVAIAAGTTHNLAIIKTGKLAAWGGSNTNGETTIPANARMGVSQIAAGNGFSMAIKSDGRLIAWGKNDLGQITVPVAATTGIAQIAAGDNHGLALRADGVVVAWGDNSVGQSTVPTSITDAIFIAANANSSAAVTSDGNVYVWGATDSVTNCCAGTSAIALNDTQILTNQVDSTQSQYYPIFPDWNVNYYRNQFNGLIPGRRYKYEITIRNAFGTASYTGKFTTNQRYSTLYLPFLTNTDGATAVNTTSGK